MTCPAPAFTHGSDRIDHHDALPIAAADDHGVAIQGPDGSLVELDWDTLRCEASRPAPFASLFRDLLIRAETCLRGV
ncbi:hypothetical protein SAMN04488120_103192 [Fontimonas thermophila]|uniref:Uncharacterized protein n=1 Tax=Fontimonas thermophila TaxID=1076937 RepID=A0A1I2IEY8_9GAMM|nr:hypothetical protein [Fontimonas thermophila]SFF39647.1 hypothetical protein SAMN04488120_103192 [Fontimonas thermophila]